MSDLPFLPLWVAKYEARTSHLSFEEDGCYMRLLRLCWVTPGCRVPIDRSWLIRRLRTDEPTYDRIVAPILGEFFYKERGYWKNARLSEFYMQNLDVRRKRSEAGSKGGKNKALKDKDSEAGKRASKAAGKTPANDKPGHGIPEPEAIFKKAKSVFLNECRRALGPGAPPETDDEDLERVVTAWQGLGATEAEILSVLQRCTAKARKKPLRYLAALKREISMAIAQRSAAPQQASARTSRPLIEPEDPRARQCLHEVIGAFGMNAAEAWLGGAAWTDDEVQLPSEYDRVQVDQRFGGVLRNHGFAAGLQAS